MTSTNMFYRQESLLGEVVNAECSTRITKTQKFTALPSYVLKLEYGYILNKELKYLKMYHQAGLPKESARLETITRLSSMGILGCNPSLYIENHDDAYLNQIINMFESRGERLRKAKSLEDEGSIADNEGDAEALNLDDIIHDDGTTTSTTADNVKKADDDSTVKPLIRGSDIGCVELPLPTRWKASADSPFDVSGDGLEVSTRNLVNPADDNTEHSNSSGPSGTIGFNSGSRAGFFSVTSDEYVRSDMGIYYYEVEVVFGLNSRSDISVGFVNVANNSGVVDLRGITDGTWGYNGKDGKLTHHKFGKVNSQACCEFGNGDTVGCGINFGRKKIFITKNGVFLGEAFDISDNYRKLFPSISLSQWNSVRTNFGVDPQRAFMFDIDGYVQCFKNEEAKMIEDSPLKSFSLEKGRGRREDQDLKVVVNRGIGLYLKNMGYLDSLKAFNEDLGDQRDLVDGIDSDLKACEVKKHFRALLINDQIYEAERFLSERDSETMMACSKQFSCLKLARLIMDQKINEAVEMSRQLKKSFSNCDTNLEMIKNVMNYIYYTDPQSSRALKEFYTTERMKLGDDVCFLMKIGSHPGKYTPLEHLLLHTGENLEKIMRDKRARLINLNDYLEL
ncbi:hypothetical protein FOA43_003434 [Brettanomyces nanus]|uniref:B30.2/SPRY domain-containing protein n=1 Tax=Eeniella nana TaxID=13502 RepID=A0A875S513_EENNA|nr:uncharacterized protein FOA43_003434 [Brettanomyces nanus]QPG76048.1 hypothetical protein FOA43_003434 [Brettanomyces nanus]